MKFQALDVKNILHEIHFKEKFVFAALDNNKIAISFLDTTNTIRVGIIDRNGKLCNSVQTKFVYSCKLSRIRMKTINDFIIFLNEENSGKGKLVTMNSNLELIASKDIEVVSLDVNESKIYCTNNKFILMIFDTQLNNIINVDQSRYQIVQSHLNTKKNNNNLEILTCRNNKFFYLVADKLDIINEENKVESFSIDLGKNGIHYNSYYSVGCVDIDSKGNIWNIPDGMSTIFKYNSKGFLESKIETNNGSDYLSMDKDDKIILFNKQKRTIYFEEN